jgi:hypothetical protein
MAKHIASSARPVAFSEHNAGVDSASWALWSQSELVAGTASVVVRPLLAPLAALGGATWLPAVGRAVALLGGEPIDVRYP